MTTGDDKKEVTVDAVKPGDIRQGCKVYATTRYEGHLVYWLDCTGTAFHADNDDIAQCNVGDKYLRHFGFESRGH